MTPVCPQCGAAMTTLDHRGEIGEWSEEVEAWIFASTRPPINKYGVVTCAFCTTLRRRTGREQLGWAKAEENRVTTISFLNKAP